GDGPRRRLRRDPHGHPPAGPVRLRGLHPAEERPAASPPGHDDRVRLRRLALHRQGPPGRPTLRALQAVPDGPTRGRTRQHARATHRPAPGPGRPHLTHSPKRERPPWMGAVVELLLLASAWFGHAFLLTVWLNVWYSLPLGRWLMKRMRE